MNSRTPVKDSLNSKLTTCPLTKANLKNAAFASKLALKDLNFPALTSFIKTASSSGSEARVFVLTAENKLTHSYSTLHCFSHVISSSKAKE